MFVAISDISALRLAAITGGGTVIAKAASYAPAAAVAWVAVCSACAAAPVSQATWAVAAAAIDADDGPSQGPAVRPAISASYAAAAVCNSSARPFQAAAAANIGPEPGPECIRPELISGGNAPKSIATLLLYYFESISP